MPFQDDMSLCTKVVHVDLRKKPRTAINKLNYIYIYIYIYYKASESGFSLEPAMQWVVVVPRWRDKLDATRVSQPLSAGTQLPEATALD